MSTTIGASRLVREASWKREKYMAIARRVSKDGKTVRYQVLVDVRDPVKGRRNRYTVGTFRLKREAEKREREALDAIETGTFNPNPPPPAQVLTVADVVAVWMETKKHTIQANTATGYQSAIDRHLAPALGTIPIAELLHDDVQQQVNAWRSIGMGAQLIHRCMLILRASLARQVRVGQLPYNVAEGIEKPSVKKRKPLTIWTPQQMRAFLRVAQDDVLFPFWHFTLLEGMRRSEALGLRWSDIQWDGEETRATAHIQQTVIPDLSNGGRALIQPRTKSNAGARTVVLTQPTVNVLKLHRDRQKFRKQALADVWGDHDLIVTTEIGAVVNPSTVKGNRKRLMERAGVPQISTHDLRHTAATIMLTSGTAPVIVAQKIGHSSVATTADIYGHVMPSDQAQANSAVEAFVARGAILGSDDA